MDARTKEAIRYLGYGRCAIDEPTMTLVQESFKELDEIAEVKFVYRIFELSHIDVETVQVNKFDIKSRNLVKNLYECECVIMFAITLGAEVDRILKKYEKINMPKAVVFQACAAAFLESHCNRIQKEFSEEQAKYGRYLRPRFSPGYGDFSVFHQKDILEILEAPKKIGLSMTDSYMLTPMKSVTAVIGISSIESNCHQSGCEVCEKTDCLYRRS